MFALVSTNAVIFGGDHVKGGDSIKKKRKAHEAPNLLKIRRLIRVSLVLAYQDIPYLLSA